MKTIHACKLFFNHEKALLNILDEYNSKNGLLPWEITEHDELYCLSLKVYETYYCYDLLLYALCLNENAFLDGQYLDIYFNTPDEKSTQKAIDSMVLVNQVLQINDSDQIEKLTKELKNA